MRGDGERVLVVDDLRQDEVGQAGFERAHAVSLAGRDEVRQLVGLAFTDDVPDRVVGDEDLERGDHAAAQARDESLRDDGTQGRPELDSDLLLSPGREDVNDAVDCLGGVVGVQGGEHEVTGLRQGEGELNRLEVAHLAHQEDVGVLAQCRPEGTLEGGAVGPDLSLRDGGEAVLVHVLDRVLDGQDVHRTRLVDAGDDRGQGGGLSGAGRAGQEHQAHGADGRAIRPREAVRAPRRSGYRTGSCGGQGRSHPSG